jgi:Uma2 family endonuclease
MIWQEPVPTESEEQAMAQNTVAPWAELVPDTGRMTVDELLALPQDARWQYELVEGRLVRLPGSGFEASNIAADLAGALRAFVKPQRLGRVTGADGTYDLTQPGDEGATGLVPDVAFVRAERLPPRASPAYAKALPLAPDLVVEVASPTQYRPEMAAKARLYLAAGVRLVWIVWPKYQQVDVWRPGADQPLATLEIGAALDGLDVLPGFTYPLADLFE